MTSSTNMPSSSAVTLEEYAAFRQQVRQRHLLQPVQDSDSLPADGPLRKSDLWNRFCGQDEPSHRKLGPNYIEQEQTVRNDYCQHFVDTGCGVLPATAVRNAGIEGRFKEYPKLRKLVETHSKLVEAAAHPPTYLQADLLQSLQPYRRGEFPQDHFHLNQLLPIKYDVVLIDAPLECYQWEELPDAPTLNPSGVGPDHLLSHSAFWTWDQMAALPIPQLVAKESFVFLWVGSGARYGLERGREVLAKWGFRRSEDICWVATDEHVPEDPSARSREKGVGYNIQSTTSSGLTRTVQHCLMGIRGTVKRSTDGNFVHCNIDTDVILAPRYQDKSRPVHLPPKPVELYTLIENFCMGTRRIELFGRNHNLRRGWLTVGAEIGRDYPGLPSGAMRYEKEKYDSHFGVDPPGCQLKDRQNVLPYSAETENLRPKSPVPNGRNERARSPMYMPHNIDPPVSGGGAGLSGLGAGGAKTVSIQSGSETLSGPQASVLGIKTAPLRSGPSGLGRYM